MNSLSFLLELNVITVVLGCLLLTLTSSVVGCFALLRKKALVGDAVAHSVLPGVCLAFLISGNKNPFLILAGAFISGWISVFLMERITRFSKIKEDSATGLILSVFFGIGILLLTYIQHSGNAEQSGLDSFIFGKAASLITSDLLVFGGTSFLILITIWFLFKELTLVSFDKNFAIISGLPVKKLEFIFTTITVLAVVVGIQAVGVVLMAAMLITPSAAARFWTDNLSKMIFIAALLGGFSGITGALISYGFPAMPTGPWIVMIASFLAICSFIFAPKKGIIAKWILQKNNAKKIAKENVLKSFFHLGEKENDYFKTRNINKLLENRHSDKNKLLKSMKSLRREGYLEHNKKGWTITPQGKKYGLRVTRLHRLWELYLTKYLSLAPDHVHDDAENIEHIITPELERRLERELDYPTQDPHKSIIPEIIIPKSADDH